MSNQTQIQQLLGQAPIALAVLDLDKSKLHLNPVLVVKDQHKEQS